jgi:hypothetical protein
LGDFQQGFSIKWPTERVQDLYEYLKSLPVDLVSEMKTAVDRCLDPKLHGSDSAVDRDGTGNLFEFHDVLTVTQ